MQGTQKLHLQLSGFSSSEADNIHSIYALAEGRLDQLWVLSEHAGGDVRLVRDQSLLSQENTPCIYCCPAHTPLPERKGSVWPLPVDTNHVPLLSHLVRVLSEIDEYLDQHQAQSESPSPGQSGQDDQRLTQNQSSEAAVEHAPASDIAPVAADMDTPGTSRRAAKEQVVGLLQALESLAGEQESILIRYETGEQVYIALGSEQYLFEQPLDVLGHCLEQQAAFDILPCTDADYPDAVKPEPLAHLRWFIALKSSVLHGPERFSGKTVRLRRWPDMGLPGCQSLIRLAAFMQSNEASLETISEKTGMSVQQVCAFITACEQEGLVLFGAGSEEIFEKPIDSGLRSLLSQISRRIND